MAVVLRASRAAAVVLVMCALLLEGSEAAMTGKKLRTYLQKKMYQGIGGDPTRPVAKFSANDLVDVISDPARKFDCLIFLTGGPEMNLPSVTVEYKREFDFFANAAVTNLRKDNPEQLDQLIFAEVMYNNKTASFVQSFGIGSLPSAFFLKRDMKVDKKTSTLVPQRAQDRFEVPFTFLAEDFAKILKISHDIDVGPIVKPSFFDKWYAIPLIGTSVVVAALVGWKVYTSDFIKNPRIWASASFSVFAIASSGTLSTVIRKSGWTVSGVSIFPSRQRQTKWESVYIATVYLIITAAVIFFVSVAPRIRSQGWRQAACYVALCGALFAGKFYIELLSMKGAFMMPKLIIKSS